MRSERLKELSQELENEQSADSVKEDTLSNFNKASLKLAKRFLDKVNNGYIDINDINDFQRIFAMFMQINEIEERGLSGEGSGAPQLTVKDRQVLEDSMKFNDTPDGDGYVDNDSVENMTTEDVAKLLEETERAMNEENYNSYKG